MAVISLLLPSLLGIAGTVQPVRNINSVLIPQDSNPTALGMLGNGLLFGATDSSGRGLWLTDGTAAGTTLLRRLGGIGVMSSPDRPNLVAIGSRYYFVADDGMTGVELWSTDGTTVGTNLVADLRSGPDGSQPRMKGVLGTRLVYFARESGDRFQLYVTDGSVAGTVPLSAPNAVVYEEITIVDNKIYFTVSDSLIGNQMYVSDGTAAGTHPVINSLGSNSVGDGAMLSPSGFRRVGNSVLYVTFNDLWRIDTLTDTIYAVTDITGQPGFGPPDVLSSASPVQASDAVLFIGRSSAAVSALELWRSDGTTIGTYRVAPITMGQPSFNANQYPVFRQLGNRVLYIAEDAQHGNQLWSSDGTLGNTVRLTSASQHLTNVPWQIAIIHATIGDLAYFSIPADATSADYALWQTDGTPSGTRRVADLPTISDSELGSTRVTGDGSTVFVSIATPMSSATLYKYEPIANRTTLLRSGLRVYSTSPFSYDGQRLHFAPADPILGTEPWVSDGTTAGTHLLRDLNPQSRDGGSTPDDFAEFGGELVFAADDGVAGRELWRSDGTSAGTTLLADLNSGTASSRPNHLTTYDGALLFFAADAQGTSQLMRLSSLTSTPEVLTALTPQPPYQPPTSLPTCLADAAVEVNGRLYFPASDGTSGRELWSTDGTAAGTRRVADINIGAAHSDPCFLTVLGNRVYFAATSTMGRELWTSDGTAGGTAQVADIAPGTTASNPVVLMLMNSTLYFRASTPTSGSELWRSDGTSAGTAMVVDLAVGATSSGAYPVGVVNDRLLLGAFLVSQGSTPIGELWASDGTAAGTSRLGTANMTPTLLPLVVGNTAYFNGHDAAGVEPWITDGTSAGTKLLKDIQPAGDSMPKWFADFRGVVLMELTDPVRGNQLWRTDGTAGGTILVSDLPAEPELFDVTSSVAHRRAVGQHFYLVSESTASGAELFALSNDIPVAVADTGSSADGQAATINVLANDTDPDGSLNNASVRIVSNPTRGTVAVGATGTIVYTPSTAFYGTDTFTYTIDDNQGATSVAATVTINGTVTLTPPVTVVGSSGGGGGGMRSLDLLALLALLFWNCRRFALRTAAAGVSSLTIFRKGLTGAIAPSST